MKILFYSLQILLFISCIILGVASFSLLQRGKESFLMTDIPPQRVEKFVRELNTKEILTDFSRVTNACNASLAANYSAAYGFLVVSILIGCCSVFNVWALRKLELRVNKQPNPL